MAFLDENVAQVVRKPFLAGISDYDIGKTEKGVTLPCIIDPKFSWLDYNCIIECTLDSGIVVHRTLPQSSREPDSLGVAAPSVADSTAIDKLGDVTGSTDLIARKDGVNLVSADVFIDVVQRMSHSVYRFCLRGWARRANYQVPIPKLLTVAGLTAVPDDETPQKAFNQIIGNLSGIPIWFARWELWYTVASPPRAAQDPPANLNYHIGTQSVLPTNGGMQVPLSYPDSDAVAVNPPQAAAKVVSGPVKQPARGPGA